jgi:hypothetical protein
MFWDHFARRVREATLAEPTRLRWSWRAWLPLTATAATVVFAAWLVEQPRPFDTTDRAAEPTSIAAVEPPSEVAWESVLAAAPSWPDDDLLAWADQDVMSLEDLSATERVAFVRLLQEMEVRQ